LIIGLGDIKQIQVSALPLQSVETDFGCDSSGLFISAVWLRKNRRSLLQVWGNSEALRCLLRPKLTHFATKPLSSGHEKGGPFDSPNILQFFVRLCAPICAHKKRRAISRLTDSFCNGRDRDRTDDLYRVKVVPGLYPHGSSLSWPTKSNQTSPHLGAVGQKLGSWRARSSKRNPRASFVRAMSRAKSREVEPCPIGPLFNQMRSNSRSRSRSGDNLTESNLCG
jgi:hypothetical protein